jgi:hypothetical protein
MTGRVVLAICGFCWLIGVTPGQAQGPAASEYDVKAAYLYNFGKFVSWPASPRRSRTSFDVCVMGRDPFGPALDRVVSGAAVGGRAVQARRLDSPADAANCHILFVGESDARLIGQVVDAVGGQDVLTVSDDPQFLNLGGMIQFVLKGSRVRFEVNLARAQAVGLTLSSDLLRVATAVRREQLR